MQDNKNRTNAPQTTVIGANARINGDIVLDGDASVLGKVEGRLEVGGQLHLGEESQVTAQVVCSELQLEGTVRGDVVATKGVTLGSSASLVGDIFAGDLTIPAGATCQGNLNIGPNAAQHAGDSTTSTTSASSNGSDPRRQTASTAEPKPNATQKTPASAAA